jgi:hypothetical protein
VFVGLQEESHHVSLVQSSPVPSSAGTKREPERKTYKRQPAVPARRNLGLVRVDKDLGVSRGPAPSVARDHPVVRPPHGLLVDELDGGVRPGLSRIPGKSATNIPSSTPTLASVRGCVGAWW